MSKLELETDLSFFFQIDVNNAASVKVLAVGKPTNILKQLHMTADEYNWVRSIYYVSQNLFTIPSHSRPQGVAQNLTKSDIICYLRTAEQPVVEEDDAPSLPN